MYWLGQSGFRLLLGGLLLVSFSAHGRFYFVDPEANDDDNGFTPLSALASVQAALELAHPGDTVVLLPGTYKQDLVSVRDGLADAPIRVQGPPGAILTGAGNNRIVDIRHSFIELIGFTIDGEFRSWWKTRYRDKLIYIRGVRGVGLRGIRILGMHLKNAGGECLRLKHNASENEVSHNTFESCGLDDFKLNGGGKNGEAIYIGTAIGQLEDNQLDASNYNHIHHNFIRSAGSECIDIKEGASFNLIEHNICLDQADPKAGGISVHGSHNTIRSNAIGPSVGAGIRIGASSSQYARNNSIYDNQLHHNRAGSIKLINLSQKRLCGNEIRQPEGFARIRVRSGEVAPPEQPCAPTSEGED